jgi:hypothetical protein
MKKLTLTTICAFVAAGVAFAQGYINWAGATSTAFLKGQTNTAISPLFGGSGIGGISGYTVTNANSYYYELLYAPWTGSAATITSLSDLLSWKDTGLTGVNQIGVAGGVTPIPASAAAQVPVAGGSQANWVVVGWSANLGTTWLAVSNALATWNYTIPNAYFGMTPIGTVAAGTSQFFGATLFGPNAGQINSPNTQLYALPVPEPGTMALAGLGGLSLLLFRRRK